LAPQFDMGGFKIYQDESGKPRRTFTFPASTFVVPGTVIVIGRKATETAFRTFWKIPGGTAFIYFNSADKFPVFPSQDDGQFFTVVAPDGTVVDGPTILHSSGSGKKYYQRKLPAAQANLATSWINVTLPTPGVASAGTTQLPLFISEWADPTGNGEFDYEFIEILIVGGEGPAAPN